MIDTMKFKIPYSSELAKAISKFSVVKSSRNNETGEVVYVVFRGTKQLGSFNRNVNLFVSPNHESIKLELSIPKFVYGHNTYMLYPEELSFALWSLWSSLNRVYKVQFPQPQTWTVARLDLCYNWKLRTQQQAEAMVNQIKTLRFPYKSKNKYKYGVFHKGGRDFSIKFYLKQPEYFAHDYKDLKNDPKTIEFAYDILEKSAGVLRFEVSIFSSGLKKIFPHYKEINHVHLERDKIQSVLGEYFNKSMNQGQSHFITIKQARDKFDSAFSKRTANYIMEFWLLLQHYDVEIVPDILGISKSTFYRRLSLIREAGVGVLVPENMDSINLTIPSGISTNEPLYLDTSSGSDVS